jgi:Na+-driven multidrug efflux pump
METKDDVEHLNLLRIFWFVVAGLHALGGCIPIVHLTFGVMMLKGGLFPPNGQGDGPPEALGWLFIALAVTVMVVIWTIAFLQFLTAKRLGERRSYTFVQVVSALVCLSMPSTFLFVLMMMLLRGTGDARTPFRFSLLWIGLGLVLSPMLLTGALGLPRLGIAGVALGGLLANGIALLSLVAYLYRRRVLITLRGADLRYLRPDLRIVKMLTTRGSPMALESFVVQGSYFVLLAMVNDHGAKTAAAYSAAAQLWNYVQMPSIAVASAMSAMSAMNIGAQRWDRVERIARRGCLLAITLTGATCLLLQLLGDWPLQLFLPQGGETLAKARGINDIVLWGWVVQAITGGLCAIMRSNAAMLAPTLIYGITMWVVRVPFAKALEPSLGEAAIWWSFPMGTANSALLAWAYYRWGGWRNKRLVGKPGG